MASVSVSENSHLARLPIICTITPGQIEEGATFHRARLEVTVTPSSGTGGTFKFSKPLHDSAVTIDISSAVCAVADTFTPEAETLSYRSYSVSLALYEDYMVDGQEHITSGSAESVEIIYDGTLSDRNRFFTKWPEKWSLKPSSTEIAFIGQNLLVAGTAFSGGLPGVPTPPTVTPTDVQEGSHGNYYGIPVPNDGYEIRFINSLGVHENVFVTCLRQGEGNVTTERYAISKQETLKNFSRGITLKKNDHERWKMSTFPLDEDWQQWYLHEFLMARWAWVKIGSNYLPVHILPDETVKGIDRQKASPLTVEFTIEFDFNGSPF